jgi:ketosteroid isomerase-like protein
MRKFVPLSLLAGLALILTVLPAVRADQEGDNLKALVPKILAAWGTLDITKVEPYYAKDADFTYFDLTPMKYNNWQEYRETVQKAFFQPNRSVTIKANDDLRAHHRGSLAWVTFTFAMDITPKQGANEHLDGRWTMVLEKRPAGWIVVHEHLSVPLPT